MFLEKDAPPDDAALARALGPARKWWDELAAYVAGRAKGSATEWKWSGAQFGWSFRVKDAKRNLIYMLPGEKGFRVSFALGEKAVAALEAGALPEAMKAELRAAKKYAEGRPLRIEVRGVKDVAAAKLVVDAKVGA